jgi:hypothetical protein
LETFANRYMRYVRMEVFRGVRIGLLVMWAAKLCCSLADGQQCCGKHADFLVKVTLPHAVNGFILCPYLHVCILGLCVIVYAGSYPSAGP